MSGAGYEVFALLQVALLACLAAGGALGALVRRRLTDRLGPRGLLTANTTAALLLGVTVGLAVPELVYASESWGDGQGLVLVAAVSAVVSGFCLALGTSSAGAPAWACTPSWPAEGRAAAHRHGHDEGPGIGVIPGPSRGGEWSRRELNPRPMRCCQVFSGRSLLWVLLGPGRPADGRPTRTQPD